MEQYCAALCCTVLYCTVLYCTVSYCTVLTSHTIVPLFFIFFHFFLFFLGLLYVQGLVQADDDRVVILLATFLNVIKDYKTPPNKNLSWDLDKHIRTQVCLFFLLFLHFFLLIFCFSFFLVFTLLIFKFIFTYILSFYHYFPYPQGSAFGQL